MKWRLLSPSSSRSRCHSKQLPLKETKMRPCWANLPGDLLTIIAEKATTNIQYVHLRAVCKAWRRALTPHPNHLPPQFPWLMLPKLSISDADIFFYDMARSKTYRFQLPYVSGKYHCGSSHGWLVLEHEHRVSLLNPVTSRCINLPSFDAPPTLRKSSYHCFRDRINFVVGDADSSGPLIVRTVEYLKTTVYLYKWCDDWQTWREVKDIGKRVLFLNNRHSINVQCDEKQENGVYYDVRSFVIVGSFRIGIHRANLESGKVVPHKLSTMDVFPSMCGLPLWVTPSLI